MALVLADRVKETTATTGTATYTLAGAVNGFETFASIGDGNTTYYACVDGTDFEVGIGTFTASGTTLARTTILQSSNSDAAVSWSSGTKTIFCTQPAEKAVFRDASGHIIALDGRNLTNVDAATLDSVDSTSFLRSDAADTKTSGDLTFLDNVKAVFGTGSDLEIFHSSNINRIQATGALYLKGTPINLYKSGTAELMASFIQDGAVELYHDSNLKFSTSSTGAEITGDLTLTSTDDGATENPTLDLYRNSSSPADSDVLGHIVFNGENDAGEKIQYAEIESRIIDASDGSEDGRLVFSAMLNGTNTNYYSPSFGSNIFFRDVFLSQSRNIIFEGATDDVHELTLTSADVTADRTITLPDATGTVLLNESGILNLTNSGSQSEVRLYCESSNAHYASIKAPAHADFGGNITLTLPATTGTVLSTANADVATTTTSSSDADHVLINDGGVLKKITPTNLGIGSGGGGASNLNGLSDVTISSIQNNDLLKYNSTAGEWQNTNLGVTVDPSITFPASVFASIPTTVTVAPSSGSYDNAAYFAEVRNNANDTTLITDANITKTATSLTFTAPSSTGSYKLRVKAQDFGDLESEFVVSSFTVGTPQPRYYRIYGSGGNTHTEVKDIEFFTNTGQGGTKYPDAVGHMTSNTAPSPLVASSSGAYSTSFDNWKAFNSSTGDASSFWNLGNNSTYSDWYVELDIGVYNVTLQSATVMAGRASGIFYGGTQDLIMKSSITGAFSGEETTLGTTSNGGAAGTFNIN